MKLGSLNTAAGLDGRHHELFHLKRDPRESTNLYGQASVAKVQARLESRLADWMREVGVLAERHQPTAVPGQVSE